MEPRNSLSVGDTASIWTSAEVPQNKTLKTEVPHSLAIPLLETALEIDPKDSTSYYIHTSSCIVIAAAFTQH